MAGIGGPTEASQQKAEKHQRDGGYRHQLRDADAGEPSLSRAREQRVRMSRFAARGFVLGAGPLKRVLNGPRALAPKIIGSRRPFRDLRLPVSYVIQSRRGIHAEWDELLLRSDPFARESYDVAAARILATDLLRARVVRFHRFAVPYESTAT